MRIIAAFIALIAIGALLAWEVLWRSGHPLPGLSSLSGAYVAQARSLPESSVLPYGQGIFVQHRLIPLWATSRLVFAAYCEPDVTLTWLTSSQLAVGCTVAEGEPVRLPPPAGITITHDRGTS